jgi:peptide/nickel transport system permease protein
MGASPRRILIRHMLPNALTPLIVQATLAAATAIIDVAGLGFLGLGPGDPRVAEWGEMLTDSRGFLQNAPWLIFFPGLAIVVSAIGFNLLGDGLREALDPRLKR